MWLWITVILVLAFVGLTYGLSRFWGIGGMFFGHILIAIIVVTDDLIWVHQEMAKPGWEGAPDQDIIFEIGLLIRVFGINAILLPVALFGIWQSRRAKRIKDTDRMNRAVERLKAEH